MTSINVEYITIVDREEYSVSQIFDGEEVFVSFFTNPNNDYSNLEDYGIYNDENYDYIYEMITNKDEGLYDAICEALWDIGYAVTTYNGEIITKQ